MLRELIGNLLIAGKVYQDAKAAKKRLVKKTHKRCGFNVRRISNCG
jgi:hypothetical protein